MTEASAGLLRSRLLSTVPGIQHGFTTRHGGVSVGPYRSLNVGFRDKDPRANVLQNREWVLEQLNVPDARWFSPTQVHSNRIVSVDAQTDPNREADGTWTTEESIALACLAADCVTILMAHVSGHAVAAVHAGWRGTVAKIATKAVASFSQAGFPPDELRVAIGPSIGPQDFEVGPEVATEIRSAFPEVAAFSPGPNDRTMVDLWRLNRSCLENAGVAAGNIDVIGCSTLSDDRFFSYRGDKGTTGSHAGVIVRRPGCA